MERQEPLSNFDLEGAGGLIRHFRGVFMRDGLLPSVRPKECSIDNFDSRASGGTHRSPIGSFGLDPPK